MSRHVVYLNPVGVIGGAERILLAMVRQVRSRQPQWRVSVVLFGPGPLQEALRALGAEVIVLPLPGGAAKLGDTQFRGGGSKALTLLKTLFKTGPAGLLFTQQLRKTLRRLKPDWIHSNGLKAHLLARWARPRGTPIVWHLHDFYSHRPLIRKHIRRFTGGVAGAVAISRAVNADVAPVLPGVRIVTIPNSVDTRQFAPGPASMDFGASAGTVTIGLVATYANWKGQDVFLDAAANVTGPTLFVIVGGPIYATAGSQFSESELQQRAESLGIADRVVFMPFATDPAPIYRSLDIVVHASTRAEPFGLTIAEAMACGRPVIVAAAGGAAELFVEGESAIGHTPGDAQSLATAMQRLRDDTPLRERLARQARQRAVEHFEEARFGQQLLDFYDEIATR